MNHRAPEQKSMNDTTAFRCCLLLQRLHMLRQRLAEWQAAEVHFEVVVVQIPSRGGIREHHVWISLLSTWCEVRAELLPLNGAVVIICFIVLP